MAKFKAPIIDTYEREGHPYFSSARYVILSCDCSIVDIMFQALG